MAKRRNVVCPKCGNVDAVPRAYEFDCGIWCLYRLDGYDCPTCGRITLQDCCGAVEPRHEAWCAHAPGN